MLAKQFLIVSALCCLPSCSPCRFRSEESIRTSLLRDTPIGESRSSVVPKIIARSARDYSGWQERLTIPNSHAAEDKIGPIYICSYINGLLTVAGYRAEWQFANDKLKDIVVKEFNDGP